MKEQSPPSKLSRSRSDRFVGGVAAGLASHFRIDPVLVRIGFVASLALGGLGLIVYLVLLAVLPVEGDPSEPLPPIEPKRRNTMIGLAIVTAVIGVATAESGTFGTWFFGFWPGTVFGILFWTVAAAITIWLLVAGRPATKPARESDPSAPEPGVPDAGVASESSTAVVTYAESPTQLSPTELMATRQMAGARETRPAIPAVADPAGPTRGPVRDDGPSTIGRIMVWFAIGLSALVVFCLIFVLSAGTTALFGGVPMAALVILLGAGMVFAGLRGRRRISLWLLTAAVAVTLPMAAVSIADLRVEGSFGDIRETPLSVVDVPRDGYRMAAGNMTIDLRKFDFGKSGKLELPVRSGMGLTSVIVPDDICVTGEVTGKAGVVDFRGRQSNGIGVSQVAAAAGATAGRDRSPLLKDGVNLEADFKVGAFEVVDNTQWRGHGRAGGFEQDDLGPDGPSRAAARDRAAAACAPAGTTEARPDGKKAR